MKYGLLTLRCLIFKVTPLSMTMCCFIDLCGGSLKETSGIIESPNFPDNYDPGDYCEWRVELPKVRGNKHELTICFSRERCNLVYSVVISETIYVCIPQTTFLVMYTSNNRLGLHTYHRNTVQTLISNSDKGFLRYFTVCPEKNRNTLSNR